jgi:glycolate oxidase
LQDGRNPLAIEVAGRDLLEKTAESIGEIWPAKEGNYYLILIVGELNRDQLLLESTKIAEICQENNCLEILFVEPKDEQQRILRIRSNIWSVLKTNSAEVLDVTVPPASIENLYIL